MRTRMEWVKNRKKARMWIILVLVALMVIILMYGIFGGKSRVKYDKTLGEYIGKFDEQQVEYMKVRFYDQKENEDMNKNRQGSYVFSDKEKIKELWETVMKMQVAKSSEQKDAYDNWNEVDYTADIDFVTKEGVINIMRLVYKGKKNNVISVEMGEKEYFLEPEEDIVEILEQFTSEHIDIMTLDKMREMVAEGDINWKDFEGFKGTGDELEFNISLENEWRLRLYKYGIDEDGEKVYEPDKQPVYMELWNNKKRHIDIRDKELEQFINESMEEMKEK